MNDAQAKKQLEKMLRSLKDGLGVRVFTRNGQVKTLFILDATVDPVNAVKRCRKTGKIIEE